LASFISKGKVVPDFDQVLAVKTHPVLKYHSMKRYSVLN